MTVAELIAVLQEYPPDVDVLVSSDADPLDNNEIDAVDYHSPNPDNHQFDGVVIIS